MSGSIVELIPGDGPNRVAEYLAHNPEIIRYSTDKGKSWLVLRPSGETSPQNRIVAMLSNGYLVRLEYLAKVENEVSTSTQRTAESLFHTRSMNGQPHTRTSYMYVFYNSVEGYTFGPMHESGNRQAICMVERKIVYNMNVPNSNKVTRQHPLDAVDSANDGMVFMVTPITPDIQNRWGQLVQYSPLSQRSNISDFLYVRCARVGDHEMEIKILHDLMAISVIGDKYVTAKTDKLGDAFLLHKTHWKNFQERVDKYGAWVRYEDLNETEVTADKPEVSKEIKPMPSDSSNIADILSAIIAQGKPEEIMESMTLAIQYRDQQIDMIKHLNEVIDTARKAVIDASFT